MEGGKYGGRENETEKNFSRGEKCFTNLAGKRKKHAEKKRTRPGPWYKDESGRVERPQKRESLSKLRGKR